MKQYKIWLDGGSKGNALGYGSYLFLNLENQKHSIKKIKHGKGLTNNDAEWLTLISVLEMLQQAENAEVELFMDSKLIINQFNGRWKCKNARMIDYRTKAWELRKKLDAKNIELKLDWIPGDDMKMMVGH